MSFVSIGKSIMVDYFREELRQRFIDLVESKRGIQAKLSKAIGKKDNYFGAIKQGNPVNADHLRAVGLVFGSKKVCELLGLDDIDKSIIMENERQYNKTEFDENEFLLEKILIELEHTGILNECVKRMIDLEKIELNAMKDLLRYIEYQIVTRTESDSELKKKQSPQWDGIERRKKKVG
jgi:hypothetical protein